MKIWILTILYLVVSNAKATIVSERIAATNRLLPLKKITVGPDDQYHGSIDPSGKVLVFTHKANLVPHLRVQDIKTGDVRDFLPLTADSQEPSFSPSGVIAFTFYKFNARGDICFADGPNFSKAANPDPKITCLPRSNAENFEARSNPFWKSSGELGYVAENTAAQTRSIVVQNIHDFSKTAIVSGRVFSPAMKANGKYLAYIEVVDDDLHKTPKRQLVIRDLETGHARIAHFALPGISGFPAFSDDESFLYFGHYLNDSNGDNIIDGNDNAVIFRIPTSRLISDSENESIFPEQLTSLESSCSFPHPYKDLVYATCAFEGSLDVYEFSATGIVPSKWTKPILDNALATSRSYQERILILNTEKYRDRSASNVTNVRLLTNHILADETAAARSYLSEVQQSVDPKDVEFYKLINIFLQARELKKSQPSDDVSRAFREQMAVFDRILSAFHKEQNLVRILHGIFKTYTTDFHDSTLILDRIESTSRMRPLERFLYFEFAEASLNKTLPKSEPRLLDAYHIMMVAPELDEEAHIYYAYRMLNMIEHQHSDLEMRIRIVESTKKFLANPVLSLLESEVCVLKIILAPSKEKSKLYPQLDKLMSQTRGDYFLRKALYVRGILNFATSAQFLYMEMIATAWLKYTTQSDTEFIYAREVVQGTALDEAYASVANKNDSYSSSYFYESLSLTDDLESHYGYIEAMMRKNLRSTINDRYKYLVQQSFIDDNMKFVEALLTLVDQEGKAKADPHYVKHLDQAIEHLNSMSQDRDSPTRYLLLGSCYLDKLLRTAKGVEFSTDLMQKANRSLMLAYDLGRDNVRIQASALIDLGILQSRVQNHGLAVRFFALRKPLGFTAVQEHTAFEWLYADALFLSHQALQASVEISEVAKSELTPQILERKAFYLLAAEKFREASATYQEFFASRTQLDEVSSAKIRLSYGYALVRSHQDPLSKQILLESVEILKKLKTIKKSAEQPVEFNPNRLRVFAYGFLSQVGPPDERVVALTQRLELLIAHPKLIEDQQSQMVQIELRLAELTAKNPALSAGHIVSAIKMSEGLGKTSNYLAHGVFVTADAALVTGILHSEVFSNNDKKSIQDLVQNCMRAFESQKISLGFLNYQDLKLKILLAGFTARATKTPIQTQEILNSKLGQSVKENMPNEWQNVLKLNQSINY